MPALLGESIGQLLVRNLCHPCLMRGCQVVARTHDHVHAAGPGDAPQRVGITAQCRRCLFDDRAATCITEAGDLIGHQLVLDEAVVVRVAAGVPACFCGGFGVIRPLSLGGIAVYREQLRGIHVEVLVEEREPEFIDRYGSFDGHGASGRAHPKVTTVRRVVVATPASPSVRLIWYEPGVRGIGSRISADC